MTRNNQTRSTLIVEKNPYAEPINKFIEELKNINWEFPYVPQFINVIVIILILIILSVLFITIGVVSQISSSFWNLVVQTGQKIKTDNPVQSSAYAIAIGIYFLLFLPPFLIQLPFWLIGFIISQIGFKPFLWVVVIISLIIIGLHLTTNVITNAVEFINPSDSTYIDTLKIE
jgi:hypothetical protein